jgi:aminopeptidase N
MVEIAKKAPKITYLKDYKAPDYSVTTVNLHFDIYDEHTRVKSRLEMKQVNEVPLVLNGEELKLISVSVDGKQLSEGEYTEVDHKLTIPNVPAEFVLEIECEIYPHKNHALEGLYMSQGVFCTQNEPEGFRRITYFIDRPDVMSIFTTTITADKTKYPILLSNGNLKDKSDLSEGRHSVTWEDPFKKPCYLFALVAGDLGVIEETHQTPSDRTIELKIYMDKGNEDRCHHAMKSLKEAMSWDEKRFGLECDLDTYMIVVVDAFNQGAMENKGLNIFNSQCVLADPESATDGEFEYIQGVVGHEYFHNWTGNRVTCRDWFQLTLKEGLTVFRDTEFSSDMTSRSVKRIGDVRMLKQYQFSEDAGPNAHPIRPASYMEINNFYTMTIYEKGCAVIAMIQTLIGVDGFRKGMDKYFELYDGQAVTCDDFVHAMEVASGEDFTQFRLWYSQAGTPEVRVAMNYNEDSKTAELTVEQSCPKTPETKDKQPFYFPLAVGFLDSSGKDIPIINPVIRVSKEKETFIFPNIDEKPIPSLLRDFSAPVKLKYDYSVDDLIFLLAHDSDPFNRSEAAFRIATICLNGLIGHFQKSSSDALPEGVLEAYGEVIKDKKLDPNFIAEVLALPSTGMLTDEMDVCDFDAAYSARVEMQKRIATSHRDTLVSLYEKLNEPGEYSTSPLEIGKRRLKNTALRYLLTLEHNEYVALAYGQYTSANNMTDSISALSMLVDTESPEKDKALENFYDKWKTDPMVINKWFAVQSSSRLPNVLSRIRELESNPVFDSKNPNKLRSLYGGFTQNLTRFHDRSGEGYTFMADKILEMDSFNPMMAGKFAVCFKKYANLDLVRKSLVKKELERILATEKLSGSVFEITDKTLKAGA